MSTHRKLGLSALFMLVVLLACWLSQAGGGLNAAKPGKQGFLRPNGHVPFDIETYDDVRAVMRHRETAIYAAIETLKQQKRGELPDDTLVVSATGLLSDLNTTNHGEIDALVANLSFSPAVSDVYEPHPLECLPAAHALQRIGGRRVADALIYALRTPKTIRERAIIACILGGSDSPKVAAYRLQLAVETEQATDRPSLVYINQLEAVKYWLDDPQRLTRSRLLP